MVIAANSTPTMINSDRATSFIFVRLSAPNLFQIWRAAPQAVAQTVQFALSPASGLLRKRRKLDSLRYALLKSSILPHPGRAAHGNSRKPTGNPATPRGSAG